MDENQGVVKVFDEIEGLLDQVEVLHPPAFVSVRVLHVFVPEARPDVDALVEELEGFFPRIGKLGFLS